MGEGEQTPIPEDIPESLKLISDLLKMVPAATENETITFDDVMTAIAKLESGNPVLQFVSYLKPEVYELIKTPVRRWNTPGWLGRLYRLWAYIQVPFWWLWYKIRYGD